MRLALEDSGARAVRTLYNPNTGQTITLSGPFKGLKKKIKAKQDFRSKKQEIKRDNKLQRVSNRQTSKTQRQATKQESKQARIDAKKQKNVNRFNRRSARGEAQVRKINEKSDAQIAKIRSKISPEVEQEQEAATDTEYNEDSDQLPEGSMDYEGGDYMVNPEEQGTEEPEEVEYEETELSAGGEISLKPLLEFITKVSNGKGIKAVSNVSKSVVDLNNLKTDLVALRNDVKIIRNVLQPDQPQDLSGWIDTVAKVVKGAAGGVVQSVAPGSKTAMALLKIKDSKVGKAANKLINSQTGQALKKVVNNNAENTALKLRVKELEQQRIMYSAISGVAGMGTGFLIGKSKRR